jgi:hypothetical protein
VVSVLFPEPGMIGFFLQSMLESINNILIAKKKSLIELQFAFRDLVGRMKIAS